MSAVQDVNQILAKRIKKDARELKAATIRPLAPDYLFSSNGMIFFCGKMGTGKSYSIMKHILITERLFKTPYYDLIIYTSTSNSMDKTVESLKQDVHTDIQFVSDSDLLPFLQKHINRKAKFYSLVKFISKDFKKPNEQTFHILTKHGFLKPSTDLSEPQEITKDDIEQNKFYKYILFKFGEYKFQTYPSNTLLVLGDFAGHPLIKKEESPLARIFTKTRHYNLTVILVCQSWRFINRNLKRLCTDIVIWKGFSEEDFKNMILQTPTSQDWKELYIRYRDLPSNHAFIAIHITADSICFSEN
jgi:hypothetical protein